MKMLKRLVYIICCLVLLSGCAGKTVKYNGVITIATLKGPSSMGMIYFIDSVNNNADSKIKIEILNEPMQVRKMMLDGTADFAVLPTTMAAVLYNKGMDYKLVSIPLWGSLYLFGRDTTVTDWKSLRGKRVNVMAKGMTPDALFRHLLEKNGLNPETDLTIDYSFPTHIDLANAIIAEIASLGVVSEPYVSLAMQKNPHIRIILDLNSEWSKIHGVPIAMTAFLAKSSILKDNAELVDELEAAYRHSAQWVNANHDSAAALVVKYGILPDTATALASIPRSNIGYASAAEVQNDIIEYLKVLYDVNPDFVGDKIPDDDFFYKK